MTRAFADRLYDQLVAEVAERRSRDGYPPGLEGELDAYAAAMVAARAGPVPHPPPPARNWRTRARERLSRRSADDGDGLSPGRRILFVVQRYGREVAGGAELHCREFATRLAGRGHHVEVLTSRATSADGWDNVYPAGDEELDGVTVHRLGVDAPRNNAAFETMTAEVLWSGAPPSLAEQEEWRLLQGPTLPGLAPWLEAHAQGFDVVVHFSYLFATTWAGLPVSGRAAPTVLHATAHDEPAFWLPAYDALFALPTRFAWSTEEERQLLLRRGAPDAGAVIGVGVDLASPGRAESFRAVLGLGARPYLLFVGRVEAGKGSEELLSFFAAYKERHPGPLALVFVGPAEGRQGSDDVRFAGYVDDQQRADAIAGSLALVQPSFFESFSMVLTEAWAQRRPVLVQGHTDVLVGQVRRSGGGVYYRGFAEFEAAVELLTGRAELADELGLRGRAFAERSYRWDAVLDLYESLLATAARPGAGR
jgi:glycosyltransferase involved in cell wall biosynthesis